MNELYHHYQMIVVVQKFQSDNMKLNTKKFFKLMNNVDRMLYQLKIKLNRFIIISFLSFKRVEIRDGTSIGRPIGLTYSDRYRSLKIQTSSISSRDVLFFIEIYQIIQEENCLVPFFMKNRSKSFLVTFVLLFFYFSVE